MIGLLGGLAGSPTGCGGSRGVLYEGGEAGIAQDDGAGPTISNERATLPAGFRWVGGPVTLEADVADGSGVQSVTATVRREGTGEEQTVNLAETTPGHYVGAYVAPANLSNSGQAERYTVTLTAQDPAINRTTVTVTFQVPAAATPQGPPGI